MPQSQELKELRSTLMDEENAAQERRDRMTSKMGLAIRQAEQLERKRLPDEITGKVTSYRYGKSKLADHPSGDKDMPTHRLTVDIGNEIVLFVAIGSDKWDQFIAQLEEPLRKDTVEGSTVRLQRDATYGRFVPVSLVSGEVLMQDANGVDIRVGDTVMCNDGVRMEVVQAMRGYEESYIEGKREDGAGGSATYDEDYAGGQYLYSVQAVQVNVV